MIVDSYRFLPRSFRPLYESPSPPPGESAGPVWAPLTRRLADLSVTLLTSAGLYLHPEQPPFDVDAERLRPEWGDPSWRPIPAAGGRLRVSHLHISATDPEADPEICLPRDRLRELAAEGFVGPPAPTHFSVMGYQERTLAGWREQVLPALLDVHPQAVVLAPA